MKARNGQKEMERRMRTGEAASSKGMRGRMPDYAEYQMSFAEKTRICAEYFLLDTAVSLLFYRSWAAFCLFLPGLGIYWKERKKMLRQKQITRMRREFLDGMQFAGTALQSGYAMENAFSQALEELLKIYDSNSFIVREFRYIKIQVRMNVPLEDLLESLGKRSHIDDIRNFSDVFLTARKTGGDMISIVRNTIADMRQKEETRQEIETVLSGKMMEQHIMSVIPLAILGYVTLTGPSFLDGMYHTPAGILIMSVCLIVYLLAFIWGRKIMQIEV